MLFNSGSIRVWASASGTTNQGQSLSFDSDDLLFKRVQFDSMLYDIISTNNGASVLVDSSDDTVFFQGVGDWNTVKSFKLVGRAEDLGDGIDAKDLEAFNFVHVDINLHKNSTTAAHVTVDGAKRGTIKLTDLDDTLTIGLSSNNAGWRNSFNINTRDGDDVIVIRSAIDEYNFNGNANDVSGIFTSTSINAGKGNDIIDSSGVQSTDNIRGQDGNDIILSGGGDDVLRGGRDNDTLSAGAGNDDVRGGRDQDILIGGDGDDMLRGGSGDDVLIGDVDIRNDYTTEHTLDFTALGSLSAVQNALDTAGIAVRARNILKDRDDVRLSNLEEDNVGYSNGGIGASAEAATRPSIDTETGYDPVTDLSELLEIDFEQPVNSAELTLSFFFNQNQGADSHQNEVLEYRAYRNGEIVLNGTFSALLGNVLLIDGAVFDRVELEALPYNNDALNAGITNDSSDFLLTQLSYIEDGSAAGDDSLRGDKGDDILIGGDGNDELNGGQGSDTAVFRGDRNEYSIIETGNNQYTITHLNGGADATDTLRGVEFAEFADLTIDLRNDVLNQAPEGSDDTVVDQIKEDTRLGDSSGNVILGTVIDNLTGDTIFTGGDDSDPENDSLSITAVSGQTIAAGGNAVVNGVYGVLTLGSDGEYTYQINSSTDGDGNALIQTLSEGQITEEEFIYTVSDGELTDADVRLVFQIEGTNDIPVVSNALQDITIAEDAPLLEIDLSNTFDDIDTNDQLTLSLLTDPALASVAFIIDDTLFVLPNFDVAGIYNLEVQAIDTSAATVSDNVQLTIQNVNRGPVGADDVVSGQLNEDDSLVTISGNVIQGALSTGELLGEDTDPDNDVLSVATARVNNGADTVVLPSGINLVGIYGTLTVLADGSFDYTTNHISNGLPSDPSQVLAEGEVGQDVFFYSVSDGDLSDTDVQLTFEVVGLNDTPIFVGGSLITTVDEDSGVLNFGLDPGQIIDADNADVITYSVTLQNNDPIPSWLTFDTNDATFSGTAPLNFFGEFIFTITATDLLGANTSVDYTLTINPTNNAPIAVDDVAETTGVIPVVIDILANDSDVEDGLPTPLLISNVVGGQATLNLDNTVTFIANPGFSGLASFEYTVEDSEGAQDSAQVQINVAPLPVTSEVINLYVSEQGALTRNILAESTLNLTDINIASLNTELNELVNLPNGAELILREDGYLIYDQSKVGGNASIPLGVSQSESVDVYGTNDLGDVVTVTLNFITLGQDNAPVTNPDSFTLIRGQTKVFDLAADNGQGIDFDPDGSNLIITKINGQDIFANEFINLSNGTIDVRQGTSELFFFASGLAANLGTENLTYTIRDETGSESQGTFSITVENLLPEITINGGNSQTYDEDDQLTVSITINDPDGTNANTVVEIDSISTSAYDPSDFTVAQNGLSSSTFSGPTLDFEEVSQFNITFKATDEDGGVSFETLTVDVTNDPSDDGIILVPEPELPYQNNINVSYINTLPVIQLQGLAPEGTPEFTLKQVIKTGNLLQLAEEFEYVGFSYDIRAREDAILTANQVNLYNQGFTDINALNIIAVKPIGYTDYILLDPSENLLPAFQLMSSELAGYQFIATDLQGDALDNAFEDLSNFSELTQKFGFFADLVEIDKFFGNDDGQLSSQDNYAVEGFALELTKQGDVLNVTRDAQGNIISVDSDYYAEAPGGNELFDENFLTSATSGNGVIPVGNLGPVTTASDAEFAEIGDTSLSYAVKTYFGDSPGFSISTYIPDLGINSGRDDLLVEQLSEVVQTARLLKNALPEDSGVNVVELTYTFDDRTADLTNLIAAIPSLPVNQDIANNTSINSITSIGNSGNEIIISEDSPIALTLGDTNNFIVSVEKDGVIANFNTPTELSNGDFIYLGPQNALVYDPNNAYQQLDLGQEATSSLTVTRNNGDTTTFDLVILGRNDAPVAANDNITIEDHTTVHTFNLFDDNGFGVDVDAEGSALSITSLQNNSALVGNTYTSTLGASVTVDSDGTVTYDGTSVTGPGQDIIIYTVADEHGIEAIATASITVPNRAPLIFGEDQVISQSENQLNSNNENFITNFIIGDDFTTLQDSQFELIQVIDGFGNMLPEEALSNFELTENPFSTTAAIYNLVSKTELDFETTNGQLIFDLKATDSFGASTLAQVTLNLTDETIEDRFVFVDENDNQDFAFTGPELTGVTAQSVTFIGYNISENSNHFNFNVNALPANNVGVPSPVINGTNISFTGNTQNNFTFVNTAPLKAGETITVRYDFEYTLTDNSTDIGSVYYTINGQNDTPYVTNPNVLPVIQVEGAYPTAGGASDPNIPTEIEVQTGNLQLIENNFFETEVNFGGTVRIKEDVLINSLFSDDDTPISDLNIIGFSGIGTDNYVLVDVDDDVLPKINVTGGDSQNYKVIVSDKPAEELQQIIDDLRLQSIVDSAFGIVSLDKIDEALGNGDSIYLNSVDAYALGYFTVSTDIQLPVADITLETVEAEDASIRPEDVTYDSPGTLLRLFDFRGDEEVELAASILVSIALIAVTVVTGGGNAALIASSAASWATTTAALAGTASTASAIGAALAGVGSLQLVIAVTAIITTGVLLTAAGLGLGLGLDLDDSLSAINNLLSYDDPNNIDLSLFDLEAFESAIGQIIASAEQSAENIPTNEAPTEIQDIITRAYAQSPELIDLFLAVSNDHIIPTANTVDIPKATFNVEQNGIHFSVPENGVITDNIFDILNLSGATIVAVDGQASFVGEALGISGNQRLIVTSDGNIVFAESTSLDSLDLGDIESSSITIDVEVNGVITQYTINLDILGINDAPVAANDSIEVQRDNITNHNLLADNGYGADSDAEGSVLEVVAVNGNAFTGSTQFSVGEATTVTLNADGTLELDVGDELLGLQTFTYTVRDAGGKESDAEVSLLYNNEAPLLFTSNPATLDENEQNSAFLFATGDLDNSRNVAVSIHAVNSDVYNINDLQLNQTLSTSLWEVALPSLDFELESSFDVVLSAVDSDGRQTFETVTVDVQDVAEDVALFTSQNIVIDVSEDLSNVILPIPFGIEGDLLNDTIITRGTTFVDYNGSSIDINTATGAQQLIDFFIESSTTTPAIGRDGNIINNDFVTLEGSVPFGTQLPFLNNIINPNALPTTTNLDNTLLTLNEGDLITITFNYTIEEQGSNNPMAISTELNIHGVDTIGLPTQLDVFSLNPLTTTPVVNLTGLFPTSGSVDTDDILLKETSFDAFETDAFSNVSGIMHEVTLHENGILQNIAPIDIDTPNFLNEDYADYLFNTLNIVGFKPFSAQEYQIINPFSEEVGSFNFASGELQTFSFIYTDLSTAELEEKFAHIYLQELSSDNSNTMTLSDFDTILGNGDGYYSPGNDSNYAVATIQYIIEEQEFIKDIINEDNTDGVEIEIVISGISSINNTPFIAVPPSSSPLQTDVNADTANTGASYTGLAIPFIAANNEVVFGSISEYDFSASSESYNAANDVYDIANAFLVDTYGVI